MNDKRFKELLEKALAGSISEEEEAKPPVEDGRP